MHWIIQLIVQHRSVSSLLLTVTLSIMMLSSETATQQRIVRTLTVTAFYPLQFTLHQSTRIRNIFAENRRLREELTRMSTRCALLEEAEKENVRLRSLLGFDERFSYTLIPARVVVHEPTHISRTIIINSGKKQGVKRFMPVISTGGVIGKVIQVLPRISLVQLIRDPSERISVMLGTNGEIGILETSDGKTFFIHYRKNTVIDKGDTVVTSGLGGIYPRGIAVGTVKSIRETSDPLFKDAVLKPCIDFRHIEEVFVMKLDPQWSAFRIELDSLRTVTQ